MKGNTQKMILKTLQDFCQLMELIMYQRNFNILFSKKFLENFLLGREYKTLDQFFNILKNHPAFGEFIAKKFYNEFVELGNPSKEDLAFLVSTFRNSNFEIMSLLKATLSLEKFYQKIIDLLL